MLENSTYAILSPEGYSSILWKTEQRAEEAAAIMKLTAQELYKLQVVDRIIPEFGGADKKTAESIGGYMKEQMKIHKEETDGFRAEDKAGDRIRLRHTHPQSGSVRNDNLIHHIPEQQHPAHTEEHRIAVQRLRRTY